MDLDLDDQPPAPAAPRAGAKFKPKGRPQPKKKQLSLPTSQPTLSTQSQDPVSLDDVSTIVPDIGPIDQSTIGTASKENVFSEGLSVLRACSNVNSEGKKSDNATEAASTIPDDDPKGQDSATCGHFVTQETDEIIPCQTQRMQTGEEEECHWNMESLNIVPEEGIITTEYEQHTGKFQPKPRLQDAVIEEPESHYSIDYTPDANQSALMVIVESNEVTSLGNTVVEEEEKEEETGSGRESKKGKRKRARKQITTSEGGEPNKSPQKKKFKHSSRRQRNRTLEKELLETPDDEIKFLPIRDMLRLVEYREWMEKKEAKGAPAVPLTQESNVNASEENQYYYSQGFDDAEDEYGMMVETEHQENDVVKPDSPVNYQTYMNKTPRTRWSKQDTQLFYELIQEFGGDLSMVQQLLPGRTRQQVKLKFKLEERRNPLKINDALLTRSKHITHVHTLIKKLQQEAAAEKEGEGEEEEEDGEEAETTTDVPENEEPAKSEEAGEGGVAGVEEPDGGDNGEDECEGDDDDDEFWNSYKSDM